MVFDALGSNTVSTEWLTKLESKESIFPWMNYRIFSKKV
jgi:1,4-alpha-glucan branching enzyme